MKFLIPTLSSNPLLISVEAPERIFIVGANGSGKSALIQHFAKSRENHKLRRIPAHRQTWLESGNLDFTARRRRQFEKDSMSWDRQVDARWKDYNPAQKQSAVLFDLVAKDNTRYRTIGQYIDDEDPAKATAFASKSESLFKQLNDLLGLGTLTVSLRNSNDEEILARHRNNDTSFSIAKMSDGERAAVIMAAHVLTVEPGTVLLIDEPERHLHRSIIEPFLSALFSKREDCGFVISTHEVALPIASPQARVLMVRSCDWQGDAAKAWDVEILESNVDLPEDLKRDILGARRRILFVEGTPNSLDLPLYSTLFPGLAVIPKGSCTDVKRAVKGLRESRELHRVEAFGLIDRDDQIGDGIKELEADNLFALGVCSAEAIYYCSDAIAAVARRQAESLGHVSSTMIDSARQAALNVLNENCLPERMAARRCERRVQNQIKALAPDWRKIMESGVKLQIPSTVESPYADELRRFRNLASAGDLDGLISRYPLRVSNVFDRIAKTLQCGNRGNYERMVIARIREDENLACRLKQRVTPLSEVLDVGLDHGS